MNTDSPETPAAPAFNPEALGMTKDTLTMLEQHAADTAAAKTPKPRATMLSAIEAFLTIKGGKPRSINNGNAGQARLVITSGQNGHAQAHVDRLHGWWKDAVVGGEPLVNMGRLKGYPVNGSNTYAKALRRYRDALLNHAAAINEVDVEQVAAVVEPKAAKAKPEKAAKAPKAPKPKTGKAKTNEVTEQLKAIAANASAAAAAMTKAADEAGEAVEQLTEALPADLPTDLPTEEVTMAGAEDAVPLDELGDLSAQGTGLDLDLDDAAPADPVEAEEPAADPEKPHLPHKTKTAAIAAAKEALGGDATAGLDFSVTGSGKAWGWTQLT